ncbi:unnamed protein product [Oikopleura dioica]|uniref:Uncharacterized protein n=1 Tax=Oikopleura dioica TaxID=34765 RepID=E4X1H5_OIKDI|nr:unnamed protein product [Oikopleura dioica]
MGTRYFFSSSSQITNDVSLKEKRLTIDNTTLILPCVDEWDLNAQLQSHDKQITQLLLKKYEGKIWFDSNTWIFYRIRVKNWIKLAVRDNVPPQKLFNYVLSNPTTNAVILISDEDFCDNFINDKVQPTLLIPSAILYVESNSKDFFTRFRAMIELKVSLRKEAPAVDDWISKNQYGCCPTINEYIYACRISLKALNEWAHCATQILERDSFFTLASPKYFTEHDGLLEGECQFDTEDSLLPIVIFNKKDLDSEKSAKKASRAFSYWNPSIFSPIYTNQVHKHQKILGHLANIQAMAFTDLQAVISNRIKLGPIIDNLITDHQRHGEAHVEPRMIFQGYPIASQSFPFVKSGLDSKVQNAYDLTLDICNTLDAEIMDLGELVTSLKNGAIKAPPLNWDKVLISHFKISRNAFNHILKHLNLSPCSPNAQGRPSFNNWFEKLISHNTWASNKIDISNTNSTWYKRTIGERDNVKTSLLLLNRFIFAITGSKEISMIPMPPQFKVPSTCEPRALFGASKKRARESNESNNPFRPDLCLTENREDKKRKIFGSELTDVSQQQGISKSNEMEDPDTTYKCSPISQTTDNTLQLDWINDTESSLSASQKTNNSQNSVDLDQTRHNG